MLMSSAYMASACTYVHSIYRSLGFFFFPKNFYYTWFEGRRTEGVTTVQIVKLSDTNNICDFEL